MILNVNSDVTVAALRLARPFIRHWRRFADFHVRQKKRLNASQPANVRAFGACAAAGCNPLKKMALPSF